MNFARVIICVISVVFIVSGCREPLGSQGSTALLGNAPDETQDNSVAQEDSQDQSLTPEQTADTPVDAAQAAIDAAAAAESAALALPDQSQAGDAEADFESVTVKDLKVAGECLAVWQYTAILGKHNNDELVLRFARRQASFRFLILRNMMAGLSAAEIERATLISNTAGRALITPALQDSPSAPEARRRIDELRSEVCEADLKNPDYHAALKTISALSIEEQNTLDLIVNPGAN
jgi:hypothetical protein